KGATRCDRAVTQKKRPRTGARGRGVRMGGSNLLLRRFAAWGRSAGAAGRPVVLVYFLQERGQLSFIELAVFVGVKSRQDFPRGRRRSHRRAIRPGSPLVTGSERKLDLACLDVLVQRRAFGFIQLAVLVHIVLVQDFLRQRPRA